MSTVVVDHLAMAAAKAAPPAGRLTFYIAATYRRREEMAEIAARITRETGLQCTASWLESVPAPAVTCPECAGAPIECDVCGGSGDIAERDAEASAVHARNDLRDVAAADILIAFTEAPGALGKGRGGRHVEFGYALARRKWVITVGPHEHIFTHIADHATDVAELIAKLAGAATIGVPERGPR